MADLAKACRRGMWASIACVGWAHGGYLLFLKALGLVVHGVDAEPSAPLTLPPVSIVLGVYNEERVLAERLENLLALEYPRDRIEIVVASDGSTDATNRIASEYSSRGVK